MKSKTQNQVLELSFAERALLCVAIRDYVAAMIRELDNNAPEPFGEVFNEDLDEILAQRMLHEKLGAVFEDGPTP